MISKIISLILALCLILSVSSCRHPKTSGKGYVSKTIRIEQNTSLNSFLAIIMKEYKILEKHLPDDVLVEYINTSSGKAADARDALISGKVDVISYGTINFITYIENGMPLRLLGKPIATQYKLYTNNVKINSMQDIPDTGKISVSSIGGGVDLSLRFATKKEFNDSSKFSNNVIVFSNSDALLTLKGTNDLSAAMFTFPFSAKVETEENFKELYDFSNIVEEYGLSNSSFTSQDFYDGNPVLINAYLSAIDETIEYIYAHPERIGEKLSEYWKIDPSIIVNYINTKPILKEISESAYDLLANTMYEFGMIDHKPILFNQLPNYYAIQKAP